MASLSNIDATQSLDQGCVVDDVPWGYSNAPVAIVLTNPCDIRWGKASFVTCAALVPAREVLHSSREFRGYIQGASESSPLTRKQWGSLSNSLLSWVNNVDIRRYFLLFADDIGLPELFVDFQHLISIPITVAASLPRIAILRSPDREKLIVHFAAYSSRIGVDRPDEGRIQESIRTLASPYHGP